MRPLGLAVALIAAMLLPLTPAFAAKPVASAITKDARTKGMAAAPDLIASAGLECQLADARWLGDNVDPKTKVKSAIYELACTDHEGFMIVTGTPPQSYSCEETSQPGPDGKMGTTACLLPGNADPKSGLKPMIAKSGVPCTLANARPLGHSTDTGFFEVSCVEGLGGFVLQTSQPMRTDKHVAMVPCVAYPETANLHCQLTDRATQYAAIDQLTAKGGVDCVAKDRAFIGVANSGNFIYEVACQNGKGYMVDATPGGKVNSATDCVKADVIGTGCKLTDTRQAKTDQANLYTKLARAAGFACDVKGYAPLPTSNSARDVEELTCNNRPDGAIGDFGATTKDASYVTDCAHAEMVGFRCTLSNPAAAYPHLTDDLKALGKTSCAVSNARFVLRTTDDRGFVEVACSDGLQGYMIEYTAKPLPIKPKSPIICADAKNIGGGCILPGNTSKKS